MGGRKLLVAALLGAVALAGCSRDDPNHAAGAQPTSTASDRAGVCSAEPLRATGVGVTADEITIEVMADYGSALAPGLFKANVEAVEAYADWANAHGGIGCRQVVVRRWDSKLDATEAKNGQIDACGKAVALVGGNSLFNPDAGPMTACGLPDLAALAADTAEMCAATAYVIQAVYEHCPVGPGVRDITQMVGPARWYLDNFEDLHGLYLVPGDLPSTVQVSTATMRAMEEVGLHFDDARKVSAAGGAQSVYIPLVQSTKDHGSTFAYDGASDSNFVGMRKEYVAQGADGVDLWACSLSCYTARYVHDGGPDVEGTYAWMQFLPFEEAGTNEELARYVDAVGRDNVDAFGAQAWQAAVLFDTVVEAIVTADGPNAITRERILDELARTKDFTANGWMGKKDLRGWSPCYLLVQLEGGKWKRVHPTEPGTFDCDPENLRTVSLDPQAEATRFG
jgi:ABC-type branched-subunit amino acid transport system substrate-binding protein